MKRIFLFVAAAALSLGASAQIFSSNSSATFEQAKAPRVNYDRIYWGYAPTTFGANEKIYYDGNKAVKSETWAGFNMGWTHGWHVNATQLPIFIEGGVVGNLDFHTWDGTDDLGTYLAFAIPVNVTYRYQIGNSGIYIAPYLGLHLKANALWQAGDNDYFDNDNDDVSVKRVQVGMQLGVNFDLSGFYLGVGWDNDFSNIYKYDAPAGGTDVTIGTSGFRAHIGFVF